MAKLILDGQKYFYDVKEIADKLKTAYLLSKDRVLVLGKKKTEVNFQRKSLLRLGIKSLLVPIALPILEDMYESQGLELPKHEKHADLIDYILLNILEFIKVIEKDITIHATSIESIDGGGKDIIAVSSHGTETIEQQSSTISREVAAEVT